MVPRYQVAQDTGTLRSPVSCVSDACLLIITREKDVVILNNVYFRAANDVALMGTNRCEFCLYLLVRVVVVCVNEYSYHSQL